MISDIQKAVEAGKLSVNAGQALAKLSPGTFVVHKSWGFGKVGAVDFVISQMTIDFKSKKDHPMRLDYAAESLEALAPDHILAQIAADASGVKARALGAGVEMMRTILLSFGGKATQDQITQTLVPNVFSDAEFKKWWEATKKVIKKDGHFIVPAKKTSPLELRSAPVSHVVEYLEAFGNARQLKDQLSALDRILKNLSDFTDPAVQLMPILLAADAQAKKSQRLNTAEALELLLIRDEIAEKVNLEKGSEALGVDQILREEKRRLVSLIADLPAVKHKRVFAEIPQAFGEDWPNVALDLATRGSTRVVTEAARLLEEKGQVAVLLKGIDREIRDHAITSETLIWLCKERDGAFADLVNPRLLSSIISALERDQFDEAKRDRRLHDLLLNDKELLNDLVDSATHEDMRNIMQKLMRTPVFEELNKRSLMGRIIRLFPEMQALLSGESDTKQETLVVSWESLEKKKIAFDDLVNKQIPENVKEISVARSYGDLRENFEFKAAKEMQRVLGRRRSEMERELSLARGTDFANPDLTQVSLGTVVSLREVNGGGVETYTILGAWDGEPEKGLVSYQSALAQALLSRKPGDQVNVPTEIGERLVEVVKIDPFLKA